MLTTRAPRASTQVLTDRETALLAALETVLDQLANWRADRRRLHVQIAFDFGLPGPTQDDLGRTIERLTVFALALRAVAHQLDDELAVTLDRYYTWLGD